ncbi:hypothetical protein [Streptomyces fuscigenes]|uniref:hypothetical protein n=1 Tax=Streptomyces fuscigenes TaxID=1528880 RepID=UPI001F242041|nr:hypothetical protein [Streptomyces fuscigenes]MCF3962587.1 hypothetical protein [Streptomyces fuscigenes]
MRQALVPVVAWSLATGAAVTLSWWGVHSVMAGTAYDPPRAVPIAAGATAPASPPPLIPATQRPESPSPTPAHSGPGSSHPSAPPPSAGRRTPAPPHKAPSSSPPPPSQPGDRAGTLKSYTITGGRAVFSVGADSASLVSATPDAGWQVQTWTQPEWLRVTFTKDGQESSVFYTWNGHAPLVQFDVR